MHMEGLRRHVARWHARKKAKVEEETYNGLKMILTSKENLRPR
jgi:hypothetical protein